MLAGTKHFKLYLIAAIVTFIVLLLLMIKLRPDENQVSNLPDDYQFAPWIGTKDQWLNSKDDSRNIKNISLVEEMKTIKAYRIAEDKIVPDPNDFESEKVITIRFHIVNESDTLSAISEKYYGTSRRWREIFQANKDVISNPDFLQKGTKLIIPE